MKLPFQRNKSEPAVPTEIQNYYQSERPARTGVAWLLALTTLVVTLVVALGLFFGGRYIYRIIANNDDQPTTSQQTDTESAADESENATSSTNTGQPSTPSPTPPTTPRPTTPASNLPSTGPDSEYDH